MQPVETAPGFAFVSDITGAVKEPDVSWTVPALIEFDGLVAVALRFDQVAVPTSSAHRGKDGGGGGELDGDPGGAAAVGVAGTTFWSSR